MTDYVTKDGRHVAVGASAACISPAPAASLLLDLWREDVDDTTWDQWDEPKEINVSPYKNGYRGTLLFHRKVDDSYWGVHFVNQSSGDYHSFRDDDPDDDTVFRLWPVHVTATKYVRKDPNG